PRRPAPRRCPPTRRQARQAPARRVARTRLTLERLEDRTLPSAVVVNGTGGNDTLEVDATGPDSGSYVLNGAAAVAFSGATSFTFNRHGGSDAVTIRSPPGGVFAPADGITVLCSDPVRSLLALRNGEPPGAPLQPLSTGTYAAGDSFGSGTFITGDGTHTQTVRFSGL